MLQKPKLPEGTGGIVTSRGSQALRNLLPTIHHTDPAMAEFLADVFNVGRPWAGGGDPLPTLQKLADDDPVRNQQKLKQKKDEVEADLQKLTAAKTELNEKLQAAREPGVLKSKSQNLVNGANLLQTISEDVLEMEESPVSISPVFSEAETFVPDRVSDFEPSPASSKTKSQEYFPSSARFRVTTSVSSGENLKRQSSKIGTSNLSQNNGSNVGNKNSQNSLANKVEASNPTNTFSTPIQINHSFNDMLSTTASSPLSQTPDAEGDDGGYFPKSFRFRFDQNDKKSN